MITLPTRSSLGHFVIHYWPLLGDLSAVDGNNRAMQERSVIGSEKQADGGDLIRFRDPAPRLICVLNTSAI
jgi:hypothetical protein